MKIRVLIKIRLRGITGQHSFQTLYFRFPFFPLLLLEGFYLWVITLFPFVKSPIFLYVDEEVPDKFRNKCSSEGPGPFSISVYTRSDHLLDTAIRTDLSIKIVRNLHTRPNRSTGMSLAGLS